MRNTEHSPQVLRMYEIWSRGIPEKQAELPPYCLGNLTGPVSELFQPDYGTWRVAIAALRDRDCVGLDQTTRQFQEDGRLPGEGIIGKGRV